MIPEITEADPDFPTMSGENPSMLKWLLQPKMGDFMKENFFFFLCLAARTNHLLRCYVALERVKHRDIRGGRKKTTKRRSAQPIGILVPKSPSDLFAFLVASAST